MIEMNDHIVDLILKRARNEELSTSELSDLQEWQAQSEYHHSLPDKFRDEEWLGKKMGVFESVRSEKMWNNISPYVEGGNIESGNVEGANVEGGNVEEVNMEGRNSVKAIRRFLFESRKAAAAVFILGIGVSLYYWYGPRRQEAARIKTEAISAQTTDKKERAYKVLLTLGDGKTVVLDSMPEKGVVFTDKLVQITRTDSNILAYQAGANPDGTVAMAAYNSITTHKATPFILALQDGSKIWLNNESSIRYPVVFTGKEREVELTGQAYFDVTSDPSRPFKVKIGKTKVEVLGTQFDVMAYPDDPAGKITLLKGSIKVVNGLAQKVIKPLQQVLVKKDRLEVSGLGNSDEVLAWHKNDFHFNNTDLESAMRQIARWYQYGLENKDAVKGKPIGGNMSRNMSVTDALAVIQTFQGDQAHLKIENNTIKITAALTR
jgi:transmembrane sensor